MTDSGYELTFVHRENFVLIEHYDDFEKKETIAIGYQNHEGLYSINDNYDQHDQHTSLATIRTFQQWHESLGHVGIEKLKLLINEQQIQVKGEIPKQHNCPTCNTQKATRLPYKTERSEYAQDPGEHIYSDILFPHQEEE
jgi:hypothetical protein